MTGKPDATVVLADVGLATLQDSGRGRYAHLGVPTSGAWDTHSYATLCSLAGTEAGTWPVIESWSGDVCWHSSAPVAFAVSGPAEVLVDGTVSSGPRVLLLAGEGEQVRIRRLGPGPVMVLIPGLRAPSVLGSVSYDSFSRLGSPPLRRGLQFAVDARAQLPCAERIGAFARPGSTRNPGTFLDLVVRAGIGDYLIDRGWIVGDVTRSGVRLLPAEGDSAWTAQPWLSGPVCPGVIQVPGDGHPIVLGPDAGTTGGYPVAGVLSAGSLCAIAYAAPGSTVRFRAVQPPLVDVEDTVTVRW